MKNVGFNILTLNERSISIKVNINFPLIYEYKRLKEIVCTFCYGKNQFN